MTRNIEKADDPGRINHLGNRQPESENYPYRKCC
jgi:hypothetical protein